MPSPTEDGVPTLADRLNALFAAAGARTGRPPTNRMVADAVGASESFICLLRSGKRDNPTKHHLERLARYFGVPVSVFFNDPDRDRDLEHLVHCIVLRESGLNDVFLIMATWTTELQRWLRDTVLLVDRSRPQPAPTSELDGEPRPQLGAPLTSAVASGTSTP